jgi:flagellar biosynthesis protein FlhG
MTRMATSDSQAATLHNGGARRPAAGVSNHLRCIAVGSGKGGVGKTTISVNLAYGLRRLGRKVLLFDGDVGLANVDLQMGLDPKRTIQDVVLGACTLDEAVIRVDNGPDVLPSANGAPELVDMGNARREQFVGDLIRFASRYDILLIDVGAGIGRSATTLLSSAAEALIVVANEPPSIMDAYALVKSLHRNETSPRMRIVVNMVGSIEEGEELVGRLNRITRRFLNIELPLAGIVPHDPVVGDAIRRRCPVVEYAPRSAVAQCIQELAAVVSRGGDGATAGMSALERIASAACPPATGRGVCE